MTLFTQERTGKPQTLRVLVASLCVLLILFIGAAQLLHNHAGEEASNPGCSLCAVAHLSALPTPVLSQPIVAESVATVRAFQVSAAPVRYFAFPLYVRPPPVQTTHA